MADVRLEKTATPGIYRRGARYVVVYRDPAGRQRKRFARTLAEARDLKATLRADVARGEYRALSKVTFAEYAADWIGTYTGRTSRGIRPETLADYRRALGLGPAGELLGDGAVGFFGRRRLAEIEPRDVKRYAAELAARGLSPSSVRNALAPARALFATAFEEGVIRSNPAAGLRLAQAQAVDEDGRETRAKALTETELRNLVEHTPAEWRLLVELLAHTGLRIGEAIALRWGDVDLAQRRLHVRRRLYRGRFAPPKSRYGVRTIPLTERVTLELRRRRHAAGDDAPVFASGAGTPLEASNLLGRVLKPAAANAGLGVWEIVPGRKQPVARSWVGFHTLRHTCATLLFTHGANAKQVQAWLGHHSPAFTLATYVHLLPDDLPDPGFLDDLTAAAPAAEVSRAGADALAAVATA